MLGTKEAPPFAMKAADGTWQGISIDLWRRVAQEAGLEFEFQSVETVPMLLSRLEEKQADVGVGALSITAKREDRIDFSHPFYESGLQILTDDKGSSQLLAMLAGLFKTDTLIVLGILLGALIFNSHLLWFFERKRNPQMFPTTYLAGVWEAASAGRPGRPHQGATATASPGTSTGKWTWAARRCPSLRRRSWVISSST